MPDQLSIAALPEFDLTGARTKVTSPVGPRGGGYHWGTDQGSDDGIDIGTPVHARLDGRVVHYQYDGPFVPPNGHTAGHNLWFLADNGRRFKNFHTAGRPLVPIGLWVPQGTVIAAVGNSGTGVGSYNAHLHEEEHVGSWSNPINGTPDVAACYAQRRFAGAVAPPPDPPFDPIPGPIPDPSEEDDMAPPLVQLASIAANTSWGTHIGETRSSQWSVWPDGELRYCDNPDELRRQEADGIIRLQNIGEQPESFFWSRTIKGYMRPDGNLQD